MTSTRIPLPGLLGRLSSDEYRAPGYRDQDLQALDRYRLGAATNAQRLNLDPAAYAASRLGTVASLAAINAAAGKALFRRQ